MNRRRGYFLVEAIAVIVTGSVIMAVTVGLLYTVFRAQTSARQHARRHGVLSRLADQFRRDVHAATQVSRDPPAKPAESVSGGERTPAGPSDEQGWQFRLAADRTVDYRAGSGELVRTERIGGQVKQRESYALPRGTTTSIEIHDSEIHDSEVHDSEVQDGEVQDKAQPTVVSLLIAPATEGPGEPAGRAVRFDAVLASDHRFTRTE